MTLLGQAVLAAGVALTAAGAAGMALRGGEAWPLPLALFGLTLLPLGAWLALRRRGGPPGP